MDRIYSLDSFRAIGSFLLVAFHLHFFQRVDGDIYLLYDKTIRFIVPFFFLTTGFLYGRTLLSKGGNAFDKAIGWIKRFMIMFIMWCAIYGAYLIGVWYILPALKGGTLSLATAGLVWNDFYAYMSADLINNALQGSNGPLWFLTALSMGTLVLGLFVHNGLDKYLLPFSSIMILCALLNGAYQGTALGIDLVIDPRYGFWFSSFFMAVGYRLSRVELKRDTMLMSSYLLISIGILMTITEYTLMYHMYPEAFGNKFVIGTLPLAIGIFLLALSVPTFGKGTLSVIGQYTLGIYVSHGIISEFTRQFDAFITGYTWEIAFPVITFVTTVLFVMFMKQFRMTRRLVTL